VLGKGDFKSLLKWRLKMREYRDGMVKAAAKAKAAAREEGDEEEEEEAGKKGKALAPKSAVEEEVRAEEKEGYRGRGVCG
jgi:hypothetical protein